MSTTMRDAAAMLGKMGAFLDTMERARTVLTAAVQAEQQEVDAAERVTKANAAAKNAEAEAARWRATADEVKADLELARQCSADAVAAARVEANGILKAAREFAQAIKDAANVARQSSEHQAKVAADRLAEAGAQLAAANAELVSVNTRIEQAKAAARQTFGG